MAYWSWEYGGWGEERLVVGQRGINPLGRKEIRLSILIWDQESGIRLHAQTVAGVASSDAPARAHGEPFRAQCAEEADVRPVVTLAAYLAQFARAGGKSLVVGTIEADQSRQLGHFQPYPNTQEPIYK